MAVQAGLCFTWSETAKTGFLVTRLKLYWLSYVAGFTEKIVDKLKPLDSDLNVYRKGGPELKKLHFNDNDRIAELVLVGNEGIVIVNNATKNFTLSTYTVKFLNFRTPEKFEVIPQNSNKKVIP